jgi:hypothetical protein
LLKKVGVNYEATAYNRAYLASALCTFAQIPLWGTSDTLGTLYAIGFGTPEIKKYKKK